MVLMYSIVFDRCECFDLHQELVPFAESWTWQKSVVTRRKELALRDADHSDTLVTLQHPPVYTLGTDSREEYLHFQVEDAPIEIHRIDRGGEVTYHGPGQVFGSQICCLRIRNAISFFFTLDLVVCFLIICSPV
jgi:lipoyl(octanoyl) transferase